MKRPNKHPRRSRLAPSAPWHLAAGTLVALGVVGCDGGSTSTPQDLAETTLDFLKRADFDGYFEETVITPEQVTDLCPRAGGEFRLESSRFREEFFDCIAKIDFQNVTVVRTEIDELEILNAADPECGGQGQIQLADNITVHLDTGQGEATVRLDDPIETNNGWRVSDELRCSASGGVCNDAARICGAEDDGGSSDVECSGAAETFSQCIVDANDCSNETLVACS